MRTDTLPGNANLPPGITEADIDGPTQCDSVAAELWVDLDGPDKAEFEEEFAESYGIADLVHELVGEHIRPDGSFDRARAAKAAERLADEMLERIERGMRLR